MRNILKDSFFLIPLLNYIIAQLLPKAFAVAITTPTFRVKTERKSFGAWIFFNKEAKDAKARNRV